MEEELTVKAIITILHELFNPNTKINEYQVASLVKCVTGIPNDVVPAKTSDNILTAWLLEAVSKWETDIPPQAALLTLALNFSVYLASKEETFLRLNNHDVFHRFIALIKQALKQMDATPNIGYIRLMSAFLNHPSGCQWIVSTDYWTEIIILTLASQPNSEFSLAGYQFVSKLIAETISTDLEFCIKVLQLVVTPIVDFATEFHGEGTEDQSVLQDIEPNLHLVNAVSENLLEQRKPIIYETILETVKAYEFEMCLEGLKQKISNDYVTFPITEILHTLFFYNVLVQKSKYYPSYVTYDELTNMSGKSVFLFEDILAKGSVDLFLRLCTKTQRFCEKSGPLMPKVKTLEKKTTTVEEQILFLQLIPCCFVSTKLLGANYDNKEDEIRSYSVRKTEKRALPQTYRLMFLAKKSWEIHFTIDDAILSLKYIMDTRQKFANEEQKIVVLQILIFCLEDISVTMKLKPEAFRALPRAEFYILQLMTTLATIIREFDVNWKDILETMILMQITYTVLKFQDWEKDFYVIGLDIILLAFSKHLSVNMALLMDQPKEDDFLEDTITFVCEKLHDAYWEIRSAAIEVIREIAQNAERFLWLAAMLISKDIPRLILNMSSANEETAVRISSFKCLQEMVKTSEMWDSLQSSSNLVDTLSQILYEESNITVLCEIVALLTNVYEYQNISHEDTLIIYGLMSYSASKNSHKDVKIKTVQFWKKVIDRSLASQGMVDGEFPEVTFSKVNRKIVFLNDVEIKRRLHKILEELNENGCLLVLSSALEDDYDVEKAAIDVMETIIKQFRKYNIIKDSYDFFEEFEEEEEEESILSTTEETDDSEQTLRRKTLSPQYFLNKLTRELLIFNCNKPASVREQLEMLREEISNDHIFLLDL